MPLSAGTRIGPYEILSALGAGGMGEVYRARDLSLGREIALKVLPERVRDDPERLRRFEQEARAASGLNHPNIVTIHDIGQSDGVPYIAMELVEGQTLRSVSAADAGTLLTAATAILGADAPGRGKILGGLGIDEVSIGADSTSLLGTMPQSTVAGRTRSTSPADVVMVGGRITDDIHISYRQGLADAEGSLRIAWQFSRSREFILRAGYLEGIDAVYRFSFR